MQFLEKFVVQKEIIFWMVFVLWWMCFIWLSEWMWCCLKGE